MRVTEREQMSDELSELERAIDRCRTTLIHEISQDVPGLRQTFDLLCEELRHVESIHHKVHKLRSWGQLMMSLVMTALEEREPQARQRLKRELASVFDVEPFVPFDLHRVTPWKHFSKERLGKGQELALVVGEGIVDFDRSAREDLKHRKDLGPGWSDRGPQWPEHLNALTWLNDRPLLDFIEPPRNLPLPAHWKGPKLSEELIARGVLSIVEKYQESHGSKQLRDDLFRMNPPFTWGEVVHYFLPETTMGERGEALSKFLSLFKKRYCWECNELFTGPKSSPRLSCPRCFNKLRKRKERRNEWKNDPQV